MKSRMFALGIVAMFLVAGCAAYKPQENTSVPAEQSEATAENVTEHQETAVPGETEGNGPTVPGETEGNGSTSPDGTEEALTPDEIAGSVVDGKYYIESINTEKLRFRIPDEIDGAPVVSTEGYMFAASDIEAVVFPDSMESIGQAMFNACNRLTDVRFGSGLKYMGSMAFNGCGALEKVAFPEGMETFEDVIFFNCKSLKEVYVPASVTEFGENTPILDPKTCPEAVVVTPAGSPAEKICIEKGIPAQTK